MTSAPGAGLDLPARLRRIEALREHVEGFVQAVREGA